MNTDDVATLVRGAKYVKALAPTVVDKVYVKLLEFDITARVFRTRNTAIEEEPDDYPTLNSPAVQRRRQFLRWYMTKLCSDPTKPEFWRYLNQVGYANLPLVWAHETNRLCQTHALWEGTAALVECRVHPYRRLPWLHPRHRHGGSSDIRKAHAAVPDSASPSSGQGDMDSERSLCAVASS